MLGFQWECPSVSELNDSNDLNHLIHFIFAPADDVEDSTYLKQKEIHQISTITLDLTK